MESSTESLADLQLWRTVTYVFPHEGGWIHVSVNMFLLFMYGWQLERVVGPARFAAIYFGSGAVGMALLFAANPIDADRQIRSGASLAVFGVVAALTVLHARAGGLRGPAMPWALGTCTVLLVGSGSLSIPGHPGIVPAGWHGFWFGLLSHSLGMAAGVLLGLAVPARPPTATRLAAGGLALVVAVAGIGLGAHRWA